MTANRQSLLDELRSLATEIRQLECDAAANLAQGDKAGYIGCYQQKCMLLIEMPAQVAPHLQSLPPQMARQVEGQAERFARNAGQALDLDSPFYMYALLYPEDHQPGEPNDLERFIERLMSA